MPSRPSPGFCGGRWELNAGLRACLGDPLQLTLEVLAVCHRASGLCQASFHDVIQAPGLLPAGSKSRRINAQMAAIRLARLGLQTPCGRWSRRAPHRTQDVRMSVGVLPPIAPAPCIAAFRGSRLPRSTRSWFAWCRYGLSRSDRQAEVQHSPRTWCMTLPGFRSRWVMPWRCAWSSALAMSMVATPLILRQRLAVQALQALSERLAFEQLHHEEIDAVWCPTSCSVRCSVD